MVTPLFLSSESIEEGPEAIVYSNVTIVNALFEAFLEPEEIAQNALRSYYVDYYLAEVENGGFAQFAYNGGMQDLVVDWIAAGLDAMGADRHAALFARATEAYRSLSDEERDAFLEGDLSDDAGDALSRVDDDFAELDETEDLTELNAAWLLSLPELVLAPRDELPARVAARAAQIPGIEARRAAEPGPDA